MRAAYTGNEVLTFMDYLDAETGRTLTAEPGGTYDVTAAATGRPVPDLPPGFVPVAETKKETKAAKAAEQPAPQASQ